MGIKITCTLDAYLLQSLAHSGHLPHEWSLSELQWAEIDTGVEGRGRWMSYGYKVRGKPGKLTSCSHFLKGSLLSVCGQPIHMEASSREP